MLLYYPSIHSNPIPTINIKCYCAFCNIIIIALLTYQFNVRQYCSSIKMNLFLGVQTHMKTKVMSNVVTLYGILTRLQ